jgi:hypothetical protein
MAEVSHTAEDEQNPGNVEVDSQVRVILILYEKAVVGMFLTIVGHRE